MKVLVTGGRDFSDSEFVARVLNQINAANHVCELIHGDARGLDRIADNWAKQKDIRVIAVPADWAKYGRGAGPRRNAAMVLERPDVVVAFPGGRGTADMIKKATAAGIKVALAIELCSQSNNSGEQVS